MMVDPKCLDTVLSAIQRFSSGDFGDSDGKRKPFSTQTDALAQCSGCSRRPPYAHGLGVTLQLQGAQETGQAENVVAVCVRKEDVGKGERGTVAHHLPLGAFATVEEECLSLAHNGNGTHAPFDGWAGGGGTKKANDEWHRANIGASPQ